MPRMANMNPAQASPMTRALFIVTRDSGNFLTHSVMASHEMCYEEVCWCCVVFEASWGWALLPGVLVCPNWESMLAGWCQSSIFRTVQNNLEIFKSSLDKIFDLRLNNYSVFFGKIRLILSQFNYVWSNINHLVILSRLWSIIYCHTF